MGRLIGPPLTERERTWFEKQHIFFVASAPLDSTYHVNVSPKSGKEFRMVDENTVCYLDYSGSGAETAAHILENGRLTIMFAAFEGDPKILRLYGVGKIILPRDMAKQENTHIAKLFEGELLGGNNCDAGFRSIVVLTVDRVTHSCGYSIPFLDYNRERTVLKEFAATRGPDAMVTYKGLKNSFSIDGLRTIGQLELEAVPTSIERKDGYYFSSYEKDAGILSQLGVYWFMWSRSFSFKSRVRDLSMVMFGFVSCALSFKYVPALRGFLNK